jgi:RES domain-containing protein
MIVWRLCKKKHAGDPLSGGGARLFGGRWNHKGVRVAYCSSTLSLATLEMLVHVDLPDLPTDLQAIEIEIPDGVPMKTIAASTLPAGWQDTPGPDELKDIGTAWVAVGTELVLAVPSAVVPHESNYLVNPDHPDIKRVTIMAPTPFSMDPRLLSPHGKTP